MGTACNGSTDVTVKTPDSKPTGFKEKMGDPEPFISDGRNYGFAALPPPDPPDITDDLVRRRRASQAMALMLGRGRGRAGTMLRPGERFATYFPESPDLFGGK
jgi:hypothetical protein